MIQNISLKNSLGRFRMIALLEGISFLVLLFIAMPLKYMMEMKMAVTVVGWAHGFLFILYLYALLQVYLDRRWSFVKALVAFGASLIPFATFVLDIRLKKEEEQVASASNQ